MTAPGLVDHLADFVRALRAAGVPVGVSEAIDAAAVLGAVDVVDRRQLREGLAAVVVKRAVHRPSYDALFDLWWPPSLGGSAAPDREVDQVPPAHPQAPSEETARLLREELARLLLDGDEETLRRFAREAVATLGRADAVPGRQSFFSYRVLRALSPDTLVSRLLDALLAGADRGGLAEQVARQTIRERIAALRAAIEDEVRRRVAEERGRDSVARTAIRPLADQIDFLRAQQHDLAELRKTVAPLARRLAARLAAKRRRGRSGRLDFRRTVRSSLATGGVPIVTHHRPHRPHKPELVVLCDVSGSVAGFSHFTLMLTAALREQFSRVRAFAFVDTCDEVTRFFAPGADLVDATQRLSREADLVWFDGHSDYGHAFEVFTERWPEAVGPKTSLLVLGDARTNYRSSGVPMLKALVTRSRHAYWLNPEPRRQWGSGDSAADVYAEVIEMVECRNADQLGAFVSRLLPV
ncbi:MAG: VWA domain-containing protein [Geodermatophilaceae bacterium]|nr:VWA domain-containing protein [Geodermatophilaceae bacterium]MDQ3463616.1 VWA domain-containing protein [Actinomycetota bacterium]